MRMTTTPETLWAALSDAAALSASTGRAIPLPATFAGALVVAVDAASPLAARIEAALAADDGTDLLPAYPATCWNCRFRRGARCAVNPPVWFHPTGTAWPEVRPADWCGKWEAAPDVAVAEGTP
jgi:hypothetical protein